MKVLITGRSGLAKALAEVHKDDCITVASRHSGHDIAMIKKWGEAFLDHDLVYNCAYSAMGQVAVLEFFYDHWKNEPSKIIVNIGSRVTHFPRTEDDGGYWPYKIHKQCLQIAYEQMLPGARCDIKLINPGPIDTDMVRHLSVPKFDPLDLASRVKEFSLDPAIKRVDLWV